MQRAFSAIAVSLLTAAATAQLNVVIPAGTATVAGNTSNAFPWGNTAASWQGLRLMCVYGGVNFTTQSINTPIVITQLKWRPDNNAPAYTGGTYTTATVELSTSPTGWAGVTTNYATNHGPDRTVVYSGSVVHTPTPGSAGWTTASWCVDITLQTPFLYDPSAGDLVIDVDYPTGSFTGGSVGQMDVQSTNSNAARIFASSMYPNANGTTQNHGVVVEVGYSLGAGYAIKSPYGEGCYDRFASFYENFAAGTHDLSGLNMTLLNTGSGYTAIGGIATYMPTTAATALVLADDSEVTQALTSGSIPTPTGPTNQLTVCSNGFVSVATGNGTGFTPSAGTAINNPQTGWYNWHDYNPAAAGSGQVMWEETPTHVYVTWDNVFSFGTTGPGNTFQYQFEKATGHVAIVWVNIDNTGNGHVVGYSPGGTSGDPGNTDLSAALAGAFNIPGGDTVAINLDGDARPVIGTTVNLNVADIPSGSVLAALILGLTKNDPGINLAPFGMPDCFQFCSQEAVTLILSPATSATRPFVIPNDPGLAGVIVLSQAAAFDPAGGHNPTGAVTSNGVQLTLDVN